MLYTHPAINGADAVMGLIYCVFIFYFLQLTAGSKIMCASAIGGGAQSSNATLISQLRAICDDYINTIGEHAYDPDCEDPGFVF